MRDVVTPERLKVLFKYWDSMGFDNLSGRNVAIIDIISSGFNLNSFLNHFKRYFKEKSLPEPNLFFVRMCYSNDPKGMTYCYKDRGETVYSAELQNGQGTLVFTGKPEDKGLHPHELPTFTLNLMADVTQFLDRTETQEAFTQGISYLACAWVETENGGLDPRAKAPLYDWGKDLLKNLIHSQGKEEDLKKIISDFFTDKEDQEKIEAGLKDVNDALKIDYSKKSLELFNVVNKFGPKFVERIGTYSEIRKFLKANK